jgi:CubicO group peptidase (beta-lactamase class C family)
MANKFAPLEEFIAERMSKTKLSAVSIVVVKGDETIYERGFGLANRELGIPATPRTNYCIGSVTKSFTCLAIMQLQEGGLLSIDDPVEKYLPVTVKPLGKTPTLRNLMSHTIGIPATAYLENMLRFHHGASDHLSPIGGVDDMVEFVNGSAGWAETLPGSRWFYYNEGYILLGAIIEKLSGMPYAEYIRENILLPLQMTRSFHNRDLANGDPEMATPYVLDQDGKFAAREYPWGQAQADGGLISNTADMAKYIRMYFREGAGPGGSIVKPESVREMETPFVRTPGEHVTTGKPTQMYGLGLGNTELFGHRVIGHGGAMYVATSDLKFIPDLKLGVFVQANGSGYALANFAHFALALAMGEDPWQLPALRVEKVLDSLTGHYSTYRETQKLTVKRNGDYLVLQYKDKYNEVNTTLVPKDLDAGHPQFWTYSGGNRQIIEFFVRGADVILLNERYKFIRTGLL